ncbi:MAG: phenylalanine--tRNA ligase subunit alpha [Phycisphaerales bacterium]|nr:phenylalanine--tRNA ligase subunit alpha [Phycisphaerales bacterium]
MSFGTLDQLQESALAKLAAVTDAASLEAWRVEFIGAKGKVKAALGATKDIPKDDRPAYGQRVNALATTLQSAFDARQSELGATTQGKPQGPRIDMTEPGELLSEAVGRQHIITRVRNELCEVFGRMGFEVATGPELEDDEHNFVKLNIPAGHPAREPNDNFYIDDPTKVPQARMLRSQTSTVQARVMQARVKASKNPVGGLDSSIKIIAPGRVYRPDTVDATHSFMFHQIEGLYIDRQVSMADLKNTLLQFAHAYFGPEALIRLRPTFFPFTEPSAELDLRIRLREDQPLRWMELGGCGMVHPNVLKACGVDPEVWTGFAFGFGIERLAMGKYAVPDIRMLFENDLRFLRQL